MDDLLAHAEAMLTCGPGFWVRVGIRRHGHDTLGETVRNLREIESCFCAALADRLHTLVQQQAIDREVWDFIARSRDRLKIFLGPNACDDWTALGFSSGPGPVPATLSTRLATVRALASHFRLNPGQQSAASGITAARASRLLAGAQVVLNRLTACHKHLRAQARLRSGAVARLQTVTSEVIGELQTRLANKDPRWLVTRLNDASPPKGESCLQSPPPKTAVQAGAQFPGLPRPLLRQERVSRDPGRDRNTALHEPKTRVDDEGAPEHRQLIGLTAAPAVLSTPRSVIFSKCHANSLEGSSGSPALPSLDCENLKLAALLAWLFPPR